MDTKMMFFGLTRLVFLSSTVNVIGGKADFYDHLREKRIFLIINKMLRCTSKIVRRMIVAWFILADHLVLIACSIALEKWVQSFIVSYP